MIIKESSSSKHIYHTIDVNGDIYYRHENLEYDYVESIWKRKSLTWSSDLPTGGLNDSKYRRMVEHTNLEREFILNGIIQS